jgi:putative membrane protein insertion efficiency factor
VRIRAIIRHLLVLPIALYRRAISPLMPPSCIYVPSCSAYAERAVLRHGLLAGSLLAIARILRCVGALYEGGEDPVPESFSLKAVGDGYRRFLRRRKPGASRGGREPELRDGESGDTIGRGGGTPLP